ncbi:MAG TPA: hypothetical protein V6D05_11055 [Stenomitos sp.]
MDEHSSARAALAVNQVFGNTNIKVLLGGIAGWKSAGYPVVETGI